MPDTNFRESDLGRAYAEHIERLSLRFAHALAVAGYDRVLVCSGCEQHVARDDQAYPYRAEPYFLQWLPLPDAPGSVIELVAGRRPRLVFVQSRDFWHAPPANPTGYWIEHFEIVTVADAREAARVLARGRGRTAAVGEPGYTISGCDSINDPELLHCLDYERAFKTSYEIHCMRRATERAVRGHVAVAGELAKGVSEFALSQAYCSACEQREIDLPYQSIVALNEHAAILHYQKLERTAPATTRSLLIDAGASYGGYAADITRTYAATGRGRFAELIAAMEELQQSLCAEVAAGVDYVDLNERAHERLAAVMRSQGLLACSAEAAFESGLTRTFLPHGLGHLLGLQVHDAGGRQIAADGSERAPPKGHPFLRLTRRLEPGFVLTIEPGIYFIPTLLDALDKRQRQSLAWRAIEELAPYGGIRIEDNLLVELHGARNLTRAAFASH